MASCTGMRCDRSNLNMEKKMATVKVVSLDNARPAGQRKMPYKSIVLMAEQLNESPYILPGPKGYLSPSTMAAWQLCPHAVYQKQILRSVPNLPGLAMVFGNAQHEAVALGFEQYKAKGIMQLNDLLYTIKTYVAGELMKLIPADVWTSPTVFMGKVSDPGVRKLCEQAFLNRADMGPAEYESSKAMLTGLGDLSLVKGPFREMKKEDTNMQLFIDGVDKRMDDAVRLFEAYIEGQWYRNVCEPSEIIAIEEDRFAIINGIPVYFVADIVTERGVFDHKFTSASAISKRWESIPSDIQLWLYELVWNKPASLLLYAPPAKTSKAKARDLVVQMSRRDEKFRLLDDEYFLSLIDGIPRAIEDGYFEQRGKCFTGGCGACEAYEVCTTSTKDAPQLTVEHLSGLRRKTAKLDLKAIKAQFIAEAEEETGMDSGDFEEE